MKNMQLKCYLYFLQQYSSRNEVSIIARRQWNYFFFRNTDYFCQRHPCQNLFVDILIARNCTNPSLSFEKSFRRNSYRAPYSWEGRGTMFLSYYTLLRLPGCFAWTLGLWLRPRSMVSPWILWYLDTRALWILDSGFAQTSGQREHSTSWSCTYYHTLVFNFALDIRALCILGSAWYPLQIEPTRRWLRPWYSSACTLFSGFTKESRQAPISRHSALAIDTWAPVAH